MSRLKEKYVNSIRAALQKEFDIKNPMLIPALEKIVISVGTGESSKDQKVLQNMADTISLIAGQKALIVNAKKSVAGFKVREGFPVGIMVTLRKEQMFAFLDKLISIALPRVKDFRGLPRTGFDGRGNSALAHIPDVKFAVVRTPFIRILEFVAFAFARWQMRA